MAPNAPTPEQIAAADAAAVAAMLAVCPVWTDLLPARQALPRLPPRALLHAGPPLPLPCTSPPPMPRPGAPPPVMARVGPHVTAPMMNSAVVAILFEGWADSAEAARRMVTSGEVEMLAAQDWGVVTPLACVVSPSMVLQVVEDAAAPAAVAGGGNNSGAGGSGSRGRAFSPIQGGAPPAPRFGTLHDLEAHVAKLKQLHGPIAAALRRALHSASSGAAASGIALLPLAAASLAAGEECHAATTAATAALRGLLQPHLEPAGAVLSAAEAVAAREAVAFLGSAPSLFLNLWMAGCKCILMAAEGTADSSVVTAVGGNGLMVGVQLAGGGGWAVVAAAAPEPRALAPPVGGAPAAAVAAEGEAVQPAVAGAMGDSMVVDALGFGSQLQPVLPLPPPAVTSPAAAPGPLGLAAHPAFSQPGFVPAATAAGAAGPVRIGISAAAVLAIPLEATTEPPLPPAVGADGAATAAGEVAGEAPRRPPQPESQPRPPPPASALAVNLSVLDGKGQLGIVGRGVYGVPREALQQAVSRLAFVRPRP
ncbi:hypothetical protein CHLRE_11g467800v5 [Chlamydomonas reinhardtii]|uniref:Uncharacterized protein n=1 Tax=Chlamydomonas reinhardtii TaxID=3055 RepID=A0A2K3D831_CHLRE|nr:uncharacterized protein CHLRE_11g467800v5 [Chlamydomonas reinhardtii]PNW76688.1 hypothetical protein CHLRE_11g467800v5 [Chlamydomonas reinhardtii]